MQELIITEEQLNQFIGQYLWPMLRIGAFYMAAPIVGARTVPARLRIILTLFTAILVAPVLPPAPTISFMSVEGMVMIMKEVLIGLGLGFSIQVVLQAFLLAGQYISQKMGLGFASMNDPANGVSVAIISQFYLLLTTLLFLSSNGHLIIIQLVIDSYQRFPLLASGFADQQFSIIVHLGSWMFAAALLISLPLFTALMIVNISFGVMSRSAPQMNIFSVGFPITLLFGFILMWFSLANFLPLYFELMDEGMSLVMGLLR
jgi:flagellar biosynthetic protein FliR